MKLHDVTRGGIENTQKQEGADWVGTEGRWSKALNLQVWGLDAELEIHGAW